jgi:hypothetical protein
LGREMSYTYDAANQLLTKSAWHCRCQSDL